MVPIPIRTRSFGSLQLRMTLAGSVALALGISLAVSVLLHKAERGIVSASRGDAITETVRAASLLQRRLTEQQVALRLLSTELTAADVANPSRLASFLQAHPYLRQTVGSVFVTNLGGEILMLADSEGVRPTSLNVADRPYFRSALATGNPGISEPISSRLNGGWAIYLTQPLVADGKVYGVFAAGLRLRDQSLLAGIADALDDNEAVLAVVTTSNGQILAHPDSRKIGSSLLQEPRLAEAFRSWRDGGSVVAASGIAIESDERVVGAASVGGPEWLVWRSRERKDVLAPLTAGRSEAIRWTVGIVVLSAAALSLYLWWSLQPLSRLKRRTAHMFDGTQAVNEGWPEASGEIGQLQNVIRQVAVERAQMEASKDVVMLQLQSVLAAAPVGIALTRGDRFELVSEEFCRLFGRSEKDLLGQGVEALALPPTSLFKLRRELGEAFAKEGAYVGEWEVHDAQGIPFWAKLNATPVSRKDLTAGTVWTVANVSSEVRSRHALQWDATHDMLTGLGNRVAFQSRAEVAFGRATREAPAALLLLDLDRFKAINDTQGHAAGDAVLEAVAENMVKSVRPGDLVVRRGGDEFAILLERCPRSAAQRVADAVLTAVGGMKLQWNGKTLQVGVTIGVAMSYPTYRSLESWIEAADRACYAAKAAGRTKVHFAPSATLLPGPGEPSVM